MQLQFNTSRVDLAGPGAPQEGAVCVWALEPLCRERGQQKKSPFKGKLLEFISHCLNPFVPTPSQSWGCSVGSTSIPQLSPQEPNPSEQIPARRWEHTKQSPTPQQELCEKILSSFAQGHQISIKSKTPTKYRVGCNRDGGVKQQLGSAPLLLQPCPLPRGTSVP